MISKYTFVVDEVAFTGIQAVDEDGDALIYTIESDYFTIHPYSGIMSVGRTLAQSGSGI